MRIVNGGIEPPLCGMARWKNFKLWWRQLAPYSKIPGGICGLTMRIESAIYNSKYYLPKVQDSGDLKDHIN